MVSQSLMVEAEVPAPVDGEPLAFARGLGVQLGGRWILRNIDVSVRPGEIVSLIGPNGSGKSTCIKVMLGLVKPQEGSAGIRPGTRIGYVPQRLVIDQTLPLNVTRLMTLTGPHPKAAIREALRQVGCEDLMHAPVQTLSGGELQRVLLARAIVRQPELLVLDEPVQGVDFSGSIELYELIRDVRNRLNCGVLLVSHDLHVVMAETDTVFCLNGHICCSGTPQSVANSPEYASLFGARAAETLAIYRHDHDHTHEHDGTVVPLQRSGSDEADV